MKYIHEINCIRGVAIIFVLFRHTGVFTYADLGIITSNWFECLTLFAVPLFFFLSGFSLTIKYKDVKNFNLKSYYKRRFLFLVPAYLFWVLSFQFITRYGNAIFIQDLSFSIVFSIRFFLEFLIEYVIIVFTGNIITLWFILVLFQYYLLFPFLFKLYLKINFYLKQFLIIIIFLLTVVIYLLGVNIFFIRTNNIITTVPTIYIEIKINISKIFYFLPFFIYFILGINIAFYWVRINEILRDSKLFKVIISLLFFVSVATLPFIQNLILPIEPSFFDYFSIWVLFNSILAIIFLLMIFNLRKIYENFEDSEYNKKYNLNHSHSKQQSLKLIFEGKIFGHFSRFLWLVGHYSLGLFLSHRIILILVSYFFLLFGINITPMQGGISRISAFSYALLNFFLIFLIGVILTTFLWKIPKGNYIIGNKSKWLNYNKNIVTYYYKSE
jgi:peptidoglycan/LPS O-acetylase OafA/YrhL